MLLCGAREHFGPSLPSFKSNKLKFIVKKIIKLHQVMENNKTGMK